MTQKQLDEIRAMYPEKKPVAFNYMQARENTLALADALIAARADRDRWKLRAQGLAEHISGSCVESGDGSEDCSQ